MQENPFEYSPEMPKSQKKNLYSKKFADYQNLAKAQFVIGICFEQGKWVTKSIEKAIYYYKLAANRGHIKSQIWLANLYNRGTEIKQNFTQAFQYCKLAADQGDPIAIAMLGEFYAEGKGINQSTPEAIRNYKLAVDKNNSYAQYTFAKFILQNKINESQEEQAIHYLKLAIKNNHSLDLLSACENELAECYQNGIGVEKSFKKALHYFKRASIHGNVSAKIRFKILSANTLNTKENRRKSYNYSKNVQSIRKTQNLKNALIGSQLFFTKPLKTQSKLVGIRSIEMKANQGDIYAQYSYAMYLLKTSNKNLQEKAIYYLETSANQNFIPSLLELANYYYLLFSKVQNFDQDSIKIACYYYERFLEEKNIQREKYNKIFIKLKKNIKNVFYNVNKIYKKIKLTQQVSLIKKNLKKSSNLKNAQNNLIHCRKIIENLDEQKKRTYRIKARKMHNLYLSENTIFYPDSCAIDLKKYFESIDSNSYNISFLIESIEKCKDIACYLYGICDYTPEEINIIRDAMLENPKLTFIAPKSDFYALWLGFNHAGYNDHCLKRSIVKIDGHSFYALLFVGLPFQD